MMCDGYTIFTHHDSESGMNNARRTTVTAPRDDLATLEAEADRRGISLTAIIAEAIEEKATSLRVKRNPRLGIVGSGGRSPGARQITSEPIAHEPR
jgi:Ribbon-helix-helix protein, copG family